MFPAVSLYLPDMSRPLRIELPNAAYHIVNRGNQRSTVFHDDWHYEKFVEKLGSFADEFGVVVYAYCCMPNHFHLYARTREANLSRFMQSLLVSFCVSSNKKRRTSGHIFQGRFKAQLVEDELYRSRLSRYIHLNPIRTRRFRNTTFEERAEHLCQFRWSSYRCYLGVEKAPGWLECKPVLATWGKSHREQISNYAAYVGEGLHKNLESPFVEITEQSILGSEHFVDRIKREYLLLRSSANGQKPSLIHLQQSYSADEVVGHVAKCYDIAPAFVLRRKSGYREARRVAMYSVCRYCRHATSLTELAARFSVSVSALTQARDKVSSDSSGRLRKNLKQIEKMLAQHSKKLHNKDVTLI